VECVLDEELPQVFAVFTVVFECGVMFAEMLGDCFSDSLLHSSAAASARMKKQLFSLTLHPVSPGSNTFGSVSFSTGQDLVDDFFVAGFKRGYSYEAPLTRYRNRRRLTFNLP
jgi:hypothetical protein